ncbi:CDP-alcohol phosphatidyltransferase family protein [Pedococcus bigeumensis]
MRRSAVPVVPMAAQWALLGILLWALAPWPLAGVVVAIAGAGVGWFVLLRALGHDGRGLGPADHVTVTRATLACVVAALTTSWVLGGATAASADTARVPLVLLASVVLALDAVDGWVARRTRTASALGARLDMEVDAALILVLSVAAALVLGWWVLAIGLLRYALLGATRAAPWLGGEVPPRYWRKAVAALQGIVLTVVTAQVLPHPALVGLVGLALALLAWSFGTQVAGLWRARAPRPAPAAERPSVLRATAAPAAGPGPLLEAPP